MTRNFGKKLVGAQCLRPGVGAQPLRPGVRTNYFPIVPSFVSPESLITHLLLYQAAENN